MFQLALAKKFSFQVVFELLDKHKRKVYHRFVFQCGILLQRYSFTYICMSRFQHNKTFEYFSLKKCIKEEKLIFPAEFALPDNLRFALFEEKYLSPGRRGGGGGGGEGSPEDSPQFPAFSQKDFSENRLQVPGTGGDSHLGCIHVCLPNYGTTVASWLIVRLHKSKGAE
jgi:hypothetical protein